MNTTQSDLELSALQATIPHLSAVSEDGWHLSWGDSAANRFEIVCRNAKAADVERLDAILTQAHQQAEVVLG